MENIPKIFSGFLTTKSEKVEIEARYATKYSVLIVLKENINIEEIVNLELQVENNLVPIGPCRIIMATENKGKVFHILPSTNIHNFEKLFYRSKIENLEADSLSLPLMIDYKNKIKTEFKEYVTNLTYDLSIYTYLLGRMDIASRDEPAEVKNYIQQVLINGMGANLRVYLENSLWSLEQIVKNFSDEEHEHHGFYFRRQLWFMLLQAPIMARSNLKPRGYNGDSEMMRMIYQNDYLGNTTFGKILHKFSMDQPAAQSVRNRRTEIVKKYYSVRQNIKVNPDEKIRILTVACGPAVEIRDILKSKEDCESLHFSLLDQDEKALSEAVSLINVVERSFLTKVSLDIIKESVRIMLINPDFINRWGSFHFIYSMGLFDYLTAPVASAVLKKLYELLTPGGEMVIGNLNPSNPSRRFMEYWHDWKIIYRTEDEFLELANEIQGGECNIEFDETKIQMLLCIKKGKSNE